MPSVGLTENLSHPNFYVGLLEGEYSPWAYNEKRCLGYKGQWRTLAFESSPETPLDLEIGTGNGFHFAHFAKKHPERLLVGIEIKYKPLIQSIRRALRESAKNARIMRYDASLPNDLFAQGELDNVYIHFPDPWSKKRQWKHRLIQKDFLTTMWALQKPGKWIDFKTDSEAYFDWALERIPSQLYRIERCTRDLHNSPWATENFVTQFESLFIRDGLPIYSMRLCRLDGATL